MAQLRAEATDRASDPGISRHFCNPLGVGGPWAHRLPRPSSLAVIVDETSASVSYPRGFQPSGRGLVLAPGLLGPGLHSRR